MFYHLIKHAEIVIATDNNIPTCAVEFLHDLGYDENNILYYKNNYVPDNSKVPVHIYDSVEKITQVMSEFIDKNEHFICTSDSYTNFHRRIVLPLMKKYDIEYYDTVMNKMKQSGINLNDPDVENSPRYLQIVETLVNPSKKFKFYASEFGDKTEFQDVNEVWKDKYVFSSPTISMGISYDNPKTHHTIHVTMANTLDARDVLQQVSRNRDPIDMHICIVTCTGGVYYSSKKDVEEDFEAYELDIKLNKDTKKYIKYSDAVLNLSINTTYISSILSDQRFHLFDMLTYVKGFAYFISHENCPGDKEIQIVNLPAITKQEYAMERVTNHRENKDLDPNLKEIIGNRADLFCDDEKELKEFLNNDKKMLMCVENKAFTNFVNYKLYKYPHNEDMFKNKKDVPILKNKTDLNKMLILIDLEKQLGVANISDADKVLKLCFDEKKCLDKFEFTRSDEYRKLFMRASKDHVDNYISWYIILMNIYHSLFDCCEVNIQKYCNTIRYTVKIIDHEKLNTLQKLFEDYKKKQNNKSYPDVYSKISIEWLNIIANEFKIDLRHAENSGEYKICNSLYKADGFYKEKNVIFEFNGCIWHGCPKCYPSRNHINEHTNKTYQEHYDNTINKKQFCIDNGYKYVDIWQCDWIRIKENNKVDDYLESIKNIML